MSLWISVIGQKKSGKTSCIEALIHAITEEGLKVATVKHTSHQHEFDRQGTDSYRHAQAGAQRVGIIADDKLVLFAYDWKDKDSKDENLIEEFFADFDVVLVEGFRDSGYPKIVLDSIGEEVMEIKPPVITRFTSIIRNNEKPQIPADKLAEILNYIKTNL